METNRTNGRAAGVLGIIEQDGKYLFGLEAKDSPIRGKWRLLGGKLEPGEDFPCALQREIREEAGISITSPRYLWSTNGTLRNIVIGVYSASYLHGRLVPKLDELSDIQWFELEQLRSLDIEDLSRKIFDRYLRLRQRQMQRNHGSKFTHSDYMGCDAGAIG